MAQTRREKHREATRDEIKDVARRLMTEHGTAAISTRMIAREMGLTAPALYHYFSSRDELITDLIVDAFNALADAMQEAGERAASESVKEQLTQILLVYRRWALEHPIDFQLIYGNPIPGYEAPDELTIPAASRAFIVLLPLIAKLSGRNNTVPPGMQMHLEEMRARDGYEVPLQDLYGAIVGWSRLHGIIMLELFHHLQPLIGDVDAYYRAEIENLLREVEHSELS
jgi:AcrR family transcriptional regulator